MHWIQNQPAIILIMNSQQREKSPSKDSPFLKPQGQKTIHLKCRERMISSKPTEKTSQRTEYLYPPARIRHSSVFYKNKLYVWGGTIMDPESKSNPLYLYIYQLDSKRWKRFWTKTGCKQLDAFSGQCHAVINNRWYLFGGLNKDDNYISQLWRLNLDNYEWIKCDQKNQEPSPSEGGCLVAFQKNWLLHYEGFNSKLSTSQHYIYIYSIDSKNWHRCQGNYELSLKYRVGTAMCIQNGKLFMFGGAYQNGEKMEYLNDLYEMKVHLPSKYTRAKVDVKALKRNCEATPRAEHFMFPIQKKYICLLGGRNNENALSDCWLYNLKSNEWLKNQSFSSSLLQRNGFSCVQGEEFFIFGGMQQEEAGMQLMNDLWSVKIGWQGLHTYSQDQNDNTDTSFSHNCCLCYQKRNNFVFTSQPFSSRTIKDFNQTIEFPYAAFGLLMDNCIINTANKISITISSQDHDSTIIKIQDNGKNIFTEEQYQQNLFTFGSQNNLILLGCDKKVKKTIQRSNMAKQYGVNLKCGSLRLGKRVLSITFNGEILRVCLIYQENINAQMDELYYVTHYYSLNETTKDLIDESMKASQEFIESLYKALIRDAISNKINKNVLYIFNTIFDEGDEMIRCRQERNDVYLGKSKDIQELERVGFNVADSIDISLRAYLSALYLKNQAFTISLYFNTTGGVSPQNTLESIDKLCKTGTSVQLDGIVEFDFKFAEFYYLRQFKPKQRFFSNGILLYHKNRLITRYKPQLGEMIPYLLDENTKFSNYIKLFGFAELPQNIPINASKTTFTFTIMLEKMYSRLKFVDESFKERSAYFLMPYQLLHPRPRPQYEGDQLIHKSKKSFTELSQDQKLQKIPSRKRNLQKSADEFSYRKKPRRQNEKGEFTPPNYKLREIEKQMKRAKEVMQQKQRSHQVLIEHVEESEYQVSSENNDD